MNQHIDTPDLVLLDCTVYQKTEESGGFQNVSGLAKDERGHKSSAGFADFKGDIADGNSQIEFVIPTPE